MVHFLVVSETNKRTEYVLRKMMIHRSTSSRRRRVSRSIASSPQQQQHQQHEEQEQQQLPEQLQQQSQRKPQQRKSALVGQNQLRVRRASLAYGESFSEALVLDQHIPIIGVSGIDRQRSPRRSCVPNIALEDEAEAEVSLFLSFYFLFRISKYNELSETYTITSNFF
jgi:hypothetical protein